MREIVVNIAYHCIGDGLRRPVVGGGIQCMLLQDPRALLVDLDGVVGGRVNRVDVARDGEDDTRGGARDGLGKA